MISEFENYTLGEITKIVNGSTPSTKKVEYYENGTIPWITPKDLSGHLFRRISRGERNITQLGLQNSSAKLLPKGTVLFSSRAPIGYVAIAANEVTTNQGFKSFICNEEIILSEYLYYFLIAKKEYVETLANGSTFKELSLTSTKNIQIKLPSLQAQKKVAETLGDLDRKIELNYEIIVNLEKLAERTYKYWFIDEINPGEINGKAVRKNVKIGEVVKIMGGGTPKTSNESYWENGDINWFTPSDLTSSKEMFVLESQRKITLEGLKNSSAKIIPPYSLLLSSRATIGELAINQKSTTTNQGFIVVVPNDKVSIYQLYFWAKLNKNKIISMSNGSTFKEISKKDFKTIEIPIIKDTTNFNNIMHDYFKLIEEYTNEIKILKLTRDKLIRKLII
ncbi:restriction endonuclease subunit S [Bacillus thuringiensis]|uniref:restriction endonuclease subunit S n=1 Tax=Bacillus thuringiensis TaxID=1428 RepID=UPI002FBE01DE